MLPSLALRFQLMWNGCDPNFGLVAPQATIAYAVESVASFGIFTQNAMVCEAFSAGRAEDAEDIFDGYLPLVRHEQQIGIGLAIRKEILRRRGAIASAAVRAPGPRLDRDDIEELDRLMHRLERRLSGAEKPSTGIAA